MHISDIMTTEVCILQEKDTIYLGRSLMERKRIRHIPIVNQHHEFVGLLTHRDLLAATVSSLAQIDENEIHDLELHIPIAEVMQVDVLGVTPDIELEEAARIMLDHKYGCLPVIKGRKLVGIVTEADFIKLSVLLLNKAKALQLKLFD